MLDYERATPRQLETTREGMHMFYDRFLCEQGRTPKFALHEKKVKPALALENKSSLIEIGVGQGTHLFSYRETDYIGFDDNLRAVTAAHTAASSFGLSSGSIRLRTQGPLPVPSHSTDRIMSVCTLHETAQPEFELDEMDRVLRREGIAVIVERLCAIGENEEAKKRLRETPVTLPEWFRRQAYDVQEERFQATYWGESLVGPPLFNFYMLVAKKK